MTHWGRKKEGAEIVNAGFTGICLSPCREWGLRMARRLGDALLIVGLVAPACAAGGYATDWAKAAKSEARLVAADGRLAGFEVALAPGAITYWRDPGDAGLPPAFDFAGSENVLRVEPVFPAPKRIREADGSEAFGYDGNVLFPLRVEKRDPSKPATLALHANYAVCEKVCLPAEARLTLALPAAGDASPYAGLVETALAAAPHVVAAKDFGELKSDGPDGWRLCAAHESGAPRDLFVEPPTGWWVTAAPAAAEAGRDCFSLTLRDKPKDAALPVALRLTLTGGAGPVETTMEAAGPK